MGVTVRHLLDALVMAPNLDLFNITTFHTLYEFFSQFFFIGKKCRSLLLAAHSSLDDSARSSELDMSEEI